MRKNPDYERRRLQIFLITWLAYAGFYLTRKSFSVAKLGMGEGTEMGLSSAQMSLIDGGYLTAYAAGQFVCGMCGDRFGTRRVILLGMFGSIIAGFCMGVSSIVLVFGIFFVIQGLCQATGWGPLSKNVAQFFSQHERGWVMGLWCTNFAIGSFVASALAGYCGERWGYRAAFYGPAIALVIVWILFWIFQRDRPEAFGLPPIEEYRNEKEAVIAPGDSPDDKPEGSWGLIKDVCKNAMILRLGAVYFFLKPTRYAILFWGPVYIAEKLSTGMKLSGLLNGLFDFAAPLSVFLAGLASDRLFRSKRMPVAVICLFGLSALLLVINFIPATSLAVGSCFFLIGFLIFGPDALLGGTAAIDFGTKKGASTAAGFVNGCGSVGAIVGGTLPGFIKDSYGWTPVFVTLSASLFIAGLLLAPKWHILPPTAAKSDRVST